MSELDNKGITDYFYEVEEQYLRMGGEKTFIQAYFDEGIFGYNENYHFFSKDKSILEIGCGGGLLSSYLFRNGYNITAIEPHIGGFGELYNIARTVTKMNEKFKIIETNLEEFQSNRKFDLIFSINVLEHVDNFNYFIDRAMNLVKSNGIVVILCPNYSFPYEPHFNIPIIINKDITYRIFSKHINNKDVHLNWDSIECWESLNWVNMNEIKKHCYQNNYTYYFDNMIIKRLFERLLYDKSLKKRKGKFLYHIINLIKILRIHNYYSLLPISFHPYLKLILSKY